jgi:hypothetical protein
MTTYTVLLMLLSQQSVLSQHSVAEEAICVSSTSNNDLRTKSVIQCTQGSFCNLDGDLSAKCELCPAMFVITGNGDGYACMDIGLNSEGEASCLSTCSEEAIKRWLPEPVVQRQLLGSSDGSSDGSSIGSSDSSDTTIGYSMVARVDFQLDLANVTFADAERDLPLYKRAIADSLAVDSSQVEIIVTSVTSRRLSVRAPAHALLSRALAGGGVNVVLKVTIFTATLGSANAIKESVGSATYMEESLAVELAQEGINTSSVTLDPASIEVASIQTPTATPTSLPTAAPTNPSPDELRGDWAKLDSKTQVRCPTSSASCL